MPFSFLDIETKTSRRVILLFITLVVFYFISAVLIYSSVRFGFMLDITEVSPGAYSAATMFKIFVAALFVAFVHWFFSTMNMIPRLLSVIGAKPIDPEDRYHLLLRNVIEEVSVATGGMVIEPYVVSSRYFNAFALSDFKGRAIIGITEGLLTKLNRRQLEAVVAHEASHLAWGDCTFATVTCSIAAVYAGLTKMFFSGWKGESSAVYRWRGGRGRVFPVQLVLVVVVVFVMRLLTLIMNTWISRERELRADATAVRLTRDPLALAEALHIISTGWRGNSLPVEELSQIFIINPRNRKLEDSLGFLSNMFTTHPPVMQRINTMLDMGHSSYDIMTAGIKEKARQYEEVRISSAEDEKIWYAQDKEQWQGPFSMFEMSKLNWLNPFTWVSTEHDKGAKPAHEYNELNKMLKKGLPLDMNIRSCLSCSHGLERVFYEGVPIWKCGGCGGRLVKRSHLQRILTREEMGFSPGIEEKVKEIRNVSRKNKGRYIKNQDSQLVCPCCSNKMKRTFYHAILPYRVEIDICQVCDLIWFDPNELEIIQFVTEGRVLNY